MAARLRTIAAAALALAPLLAACNPDTLTEAERKQVASLSLAALAPLPPDPTNRVADDPAAAALGEALFFDTAMSPSGTVACGTCHQADRQFQDGLLLGKGVGTTDRRTMPIAGAAYSPFQFWDGRADSLWAQALWPMEEAREHGGTRAFYVHVVAQKYRDAYEAVFGPLPDIAGLPPAAGPKGTAAERAAWEALDGGRQDGVNRAYANIGKAIAAYERTLLPAETRFDRFAAALAAGREPEGDARFSDLETEGLKLFLGSASCVTCHNGPRFTDDHFHNTGVPQAVGLPEDHGRAQAVPLLLSDPFNCQGPYSDAPGRCDELRFMIREGEELERAFKTPSLRGAAGRAPYMHSGQIATLEDVVAHYSAAPAAPSGHSEVNPITLTDRGRAALVAFLKTLDAE